MSNPRVDFLFPEKPLFQRFFHFIHFIHNIIMETSELFKSDPMYGKMRVMKNRGSWYELQRLISN